jgi:TRAP transporter TAXI family solute receptor
MDKARESPQRRGLRQRLATVSWRDFLVTAIPTALVLLGAVWFASKASRLAPPSTIRFASGPTGSGFRNQADKYRDILARHGVKVVVLPTRGALDNLDKLAGKAADVGFVQGGLAEGRDLPHLVSLGSLYPQPLMIYTRTAKPIERLTDLRGKRLAIPPEGSGARVLAQKLLQANEMDKPPTVLVGLDAEEAQRQLVAGKVDAAFLMGDVATPQVMRSLREVPAIELASFRQADGYLRKFRFLSKLTLPEGAMDLGRDYPPQAIELVGPTVELVARDDLHPALSDLLIGAAREIHGGAGLFRNAGEYPAPLARDFPISADAERYYKSGQQFLYKRLPFWLASLIDRLLVIVLPLLVVLVPATRLAPAVYRWRVRSHIYRYYGVLMSLEREMRGNPSAEVRARVLARLEEITRAVSDLKTPPSFGDQLYVLRDHVATVRRRLESTGA